MAAVKPNALPWLGASALVLLLDQLTKAWVLASLPEYTAVPVIDGFWNWYRTYNTGVDILLANPRGFCAGVDRAIEIVEARHRDPRRADLRAPRGRAQQVRGRRPARPRARSSSRSWTKCRTATPR
jgi:hypothetical protein